MVIFMFLRKLLILIYSIGLFFSLSVDAREYSPSLGNISKSGNTVTTNIIDKTESKSLGSIEWEAKIKCSEFGFANECGTEVKEPKNLATNVKIELSGLRAEAFKKNNSSYEDCCVYNYSTVTFTDTGTSKIKVFSPKKRYERCCDKSNPGALLVRLGEFTSINVDDGVLLKWKTTEEINNSGFRAWRATKDQYDNYKPTLLREFGHSEQFDPDPDESCSTKIQGQLKADNPSQPPKLISAIGNSAESTCYSFTDTSNLNDGTYYYLLEDIGDNGKSTFHCDQIDAVTVGQGPAIDLESAINYCKEVTGSNN